MNASVAIRTSSLSFIRQHALRHLVCGFVWVSLISSTVHAASATWTTTNGNWNSTTWSTGSAPGATSGTTNTDTATFNGGGGTIVVDPNRNIENITFGTSVSSGYTLSAGTGTPGTLLLSDGGTLQTLSAGGNTVTIDPATILEGNYTFSSNYTSSGSHITYSGSITGVATTGNTNTLTLSGVHAQLGSISDTINGIISDGSGGGSLAITKTGTGYWTLTGAETYSGPTTIAQGVLMLTNTASLANSSVTTTGGILDYYNTGATSAVSATPVASVTLNGGALQINGSTTAGVTSADTVTTLTLGPGGYNNATNTNFLNNSNGGGGNTIALSVGVASTGGNVNLTIGNLVVNTGGTVAFMSTNGALGADSIASATAGTGNIQINAVNGGSVASALVGGGGAQGTVTTSILPFAVGAGSGGATPTGFVTYDPTNGIELLTTYQATVSGVSGTVTSDNVELSLATGQTDAMTANTTINSLIISPSSSGNGNNLSLGGHTLIVTSGALMFTSASKGSNIGVTANSTLQLGTGGTGYIELGDGRSNTISAAITGPSGTGLVVNGNIVSATGAIPILVLTGANNYSGGTIINNAIVEVGSGGATGNLGSGTITLNNSNVEFDLTSNTTISGTITSSPANGTSNSVSTLAGNTGTLTLSGSNSYTGGTTVGGGTLMLANGTNGSATGSGALTVNAASTISGVGTSNSSDFIIAGHVIAGSGAPTDTTGTTTITGAAVLNNSSLAGATLSFNLNSATKTTTSVDVGSTGVNLASATLSLTLQGTSVIPANTPFVLISGVNSGDIAGVDGSQYTGFTTTLNSQGQLVISGLNLSFTDPTDASWYSDSYLFLDMSNGVDDIDVEVVPEPGTWALMLGGLATLVFWQRRRFRA